MSFGFVRSAAESTPKALLARETLDEVDAYTAAGFPPPDHALTGTSPVVNAFRRLAFGHDGG